MAAPPAASAIEGPLGRDDPAFSPAQITAIADAVREALTNVRKHAQTTSATVTVSRDAAGLLVEISDHGTGFDPATSASGYGIEHSIRHRITEAGGNAHIDSAPGTGTHIELRLPAPR